MHGYTEITSQQEADRLFEQVHHFHDALTKEMRIVSDGWVSEDLSMMPPERFQAQLLIQSQFQPVAVELFFHGVASLQVIAASYCFEGSIEYSGGAQRRGQAEGDVVLRLDDLEITATRAFYRLRPTWHGRALRLRGDLPCIDAVPATRLKGEWRQCPECCEAWEEAQEVQFSRCPGCGRVTELVVDLAG